MPHVQLRAAQLKADGSWRKFVINGHHWVPIDDENTMVWNFSYSLDEPLTEKERSERDSGNGPDAVDQTTFRSARNRRNDWNIDRKLQRSENFTGIFGINAQDRAVQEAMTPISNRTKEHLGQTDRAIIMTRKLLLQAVRTVQDGGSPPSVGSAHHNLRAIEEVLPSGIRGLDALRDKMYAGVGA